MFFEFTHQIRVKTVVISHFQMTHFVRIKNLPRVIEASHLRRDNCNINGLRLIRSRGFLGRGRSPIWLISRNKRRQLTSSLSRLKWEAVT